MNRQTVHIVEDTTADEGANLLERIAVFEREDPAKSEAEQDGLKYLGELLVGEAP